MDDPRRALIERLYAAWLEAPHLTFTQLVSRAVWGRRTSLTDDELATTVEGYAKAATLGPPPTPGIPPEQDNASDGPCPNHPPAETLEQVICFRCGAWKKDKRARLYYVPYIDGRRTGYTPPTRKGATWPRT